MFEPFFTAKEIGKGSGLGLSRVYGFVRQSGGFVAVARNIGVGTRFPINLAPSAKPIDEARSRKEWRANLSYRFACRICLECDLDLCRVLSSERQVQQDRSWVWASPPEPTSLARPTSAVGERRRRNRTDEVIEQDVVRCDA